MRILIIEDEIDLANAVQLALEEEGFACDCARDGLDGLAKAQAWDYDVLVLDLMLPGLDGETILQSLRETKKTPVLVLTARDSVGDKVALLDSGADDYLTKPFELEELIARIRALIRRSSQDPRPVLTIGGIAIDTCGRRVSVRGDGVSLSPKEYAVLELLARHRGEVVTRTMIFEHVYDEYEDTSSNVLDVYIANLRRKLGRDLIETRRGEGYIIDA